MASAFSLHESRWDEIICADTLQFFWKNTALFWLYGIQNWIGLDSFCKCQHIPKVSSHCWENRIMNEREINKTFTVLKTLAVYQSAVNRAPLPPNLHASLFRCKENESTVMPIHPLESEFAWINKTCCSKKAVYLPWTVKALTFSQLGLYWRRSAVVRVVCWSHSEQTWNSVSIVRRSWPNSAVFMSAESG